MAANPKGAQKINFEVIIDRKIYDDFVRQCSHKGFAVRVVIERLMTKYSETGNL